MSMALLDPLKWLSLLFAGLSCGLSFYGKDRLVRVFGFIACCCALAIVGVIISQAQRLPLYGPLETTSEICFLVLVGAWALPLKNFKALWGKAIPWAGACALLIVLIAAPNKLNHDFYMYASYFVIGFFQFHILALSLLALASMHYLAGLSANNRQNAFAWASNLMFLAVIVYLLGEFFGCAWSYYWLGDYWRFSSGFFESTLIFLMMMLVFHLPQKWSVSVATKAITGFLVGPIVFVLILGHQWSAH